MLAEWKERYAPAIARLKSMTDELKRPGGNLDLAVLSVLLWVPSFFALLFARRVINSGSFARGFGGLAWPFWTSRA